MRNRFGKNRIRDNDNQASKGHGQYHTLERRARHIMRNLRAPGIDYVIEPGYEVTPLEDMNVTRTEDGTLVYASFGGKTQHQADTQGWEKLPSEEPTLENLTYGKSMPSSDKISPAVTTLLGWRLGIGNSLYAQEVLGAGLQDILDYSPTPEEALGIVIEVLKGADPSEVLNDLYSGLDEELLNLIDLRDRSEPTLDGPYMRIVQGMPSSGDNPRGPAYHEHMASRLDQIN